MAPINVLTGLVRSRARNRLSQKKWNSLAYTCTEKLLARDAMQAFETYMIATKVCLTAYVALEADESLEEDDSIRDLMSFLLASTATYYDSAKEMLKLNLALMDVPLNMEENAGFFKERVFVPLETYSNDDECQDKTRFTKS